MIAKCILFIIIYVCILFKEIWGTCFQTCVTLQKTIPHTQVILPNKPLFFTVEVYKRKSMDSRSFLEHKRKCPNRGENKVKTVHQGRVLSQLESFIMLYVLHEHLS